MTFHFSLLVFSLLGISLAAGVMASLAFSNYRVRGAFALGLLGVALFVWSGTHALELGVDSLADKVFWGKMQYLGIAFTPLFWLILALDYTQARRAGVLRHAWWLAVFPTITFLLVLSNDLHRQFWTRTYLKTIGGVEQLGAEHGYLFWFHVAVSYLMILGGTVIFLIWLPRLKGLYRSQIIAVLASALLPGLSNVLYLVRVNSPLALDPTPFAFTLSLGLLLWAILGFRLARVAPIARDMVLDSLQAALVVLDLEGQVVEINRAASRLLGVSESQATGSPAKDLFAPWQGLYERFKDLQDGSVKIRMGEGATLREYEMTVIPIREPGGAVVGRVIALRGLSSEDSPSSSLFAGTDTDKMEEVTPDEEPQPANPGQTPPWRGVLDFYRGAGNPVFPLPNGVSPAWAKTIERIFTAMLRVVGTLGGLAWLALFLPGVNSNPVFVAFVALFGAVLWILALRREFSYSVRVFVFLFFLYALALAESLNYGYSAMSFTFFLGFVAFAALLANLRWGLWAFAASLFSLTLLGVGVVFGWFIPYSTPLPHAIVPAGLGGIISNLAGYTSSALALIFSINSLMVTLNKSWQKEEQARNLLKMERDLLEKRVTARTRELAEARDDALRSRDTLRKYYMAIEQSGNSIVITDLGGNIEYVNPYFERVSGYGAAEVLGKNQRILKSGEQNPEFYRQLWGSISQGQVWSGEFHNRRKDGSLYWEAATIAPIRTAEGQLSHYVAIKQDITVQKELSAQLATQNEYLSVLQTITLDLLNRRRQEDLLATVVQRACSLLDAPLGEILLHNGETLVRRAVSENQAHLYGQPVTRQQMTYSWQAYDTLQPVIVEDYSATQEFQSPILNSLIHATADFPITVAGKILGVLAVGRVQPNLPFTPAQVEIGQAFARLVSLVLDNANLYEAALQEIEERKRIQEQLVIARDQALEASRFKSQLLAKVSHELRTPLGGVIGYAELLIQEAFGQMSKDQKEALENINASANYLNAMINELLDEAQIEARSIKINLAPFAPATMLESVSANMSILAANKGLGFRASIQPDLPPRLLGDERRLQQVLINLLGNAIKFTTQGEVSVSLLRLEQTAWAMQVQDTGAGIPPEAQEFIFDPFRQVDSAITRDNRGAGLGLSITRQLVELMGGRIELQSQVGQGSAFLVILPIQTPPAETL